MQELSRPPCPRVPGDSVHMSVCERQSEQNQDLRHRRYLKPSNVNGRVQNKTQRSEVWREKHCLHGLPMRLPLQPFALPGFHRWLISAYCNCLCLLGTCILTDCRLGDTVENIFCCFAHLPPQCFSFPLKVWADRQGLLRLIVYKQAPMTPVLNSFAFFNLTVKIILGGFHNTAYVKPTVFY